MRPYAKETPEARSDGVASRDQRYLKRRGKRSHSRKRHRFHDLAGSARAEASRIIEAELLEYETAWQQEAPIVTGKMREVRRAALCVDLIRYDLPVRSDDYDSGNDPDDIDFEYPV